MSFYECAHSEQSLRKRIYSNGSIHYVYQCMDCGRPSSAIPHKEALRLLGGDEPLIYDPQIRKDFDERIRAQIEFKNL